MPSLFIVFVCGRINDYIEGFSELLYICGAITSRLMLIYLSFLIIPHAKKCILYALFGLQFYFSIIWFQNVSASPLDLGMVILQEVLILGCSVLLIRKLLSSEHYFDKDVVINDVTEKKANNISELADDLTKLNELKERGILSEEEFIEQKKKLLKQ